MGIGLYESLIYVILYIFQWYEIFKFIVHMISKVAIMTVCIVCTPYLPSNTTFSFSSRLPPTKKLKGKLALNKKLDEVIIRHKGHFIGPNSLADFDGELYTGLYGGDIVKFSGKHITPVVKTGKRTWGRPLGLRFDRKGTLFVADAYHGITKVNVHTGEKCVLISPNEAIEGQQPLLFNSVAIAKNGDILWTDSSYNCSLDDGLYNLLADNSGRLIHYNAQTKTNTVLMDNLKFAQGVALSDDEEFVIVAETATSRIYRYYLKGPKKGTHDVFIDELPGLPANLNSDGHGGFLVPLDFSVDEDHPEDNHVLQPFPLVRKLVATLAGLPHLLFKTLVRVYPWEFAKRAVHMIGRPPPVRNLLASPRTTILRLSKNGEVLDSLHTTNRIIKRISEAHIFKNNLYLGSQYEDYIALIPLSKIGWEHLRRDV